jgi:hypothetical protein
MWSITPPLLTSLGLSSSQGLSYLYYLSKEFIMSKETSSSLLSDLLAFVEADEHTQFELIRNLPDYLSAYKTHKALKTLLSSLQYKMDELFNTYCKSVTKGSGQVSMLLSYTALNKIRNFYGEELVIVSDMINEYKAYVWHGHLLDTLFFIERKSEDLWDHRGV